MKTAADLVIAWKWHNPPPVYLSGFRHAIKRAWFEKFGPECPVCERVMKTGKEYRKHGTFATIDHILARALNGTESLDNLQVICRKCNNLKSREESKLAPRGVDYVPYAFRPNAYGIP